MRKLFGYVIFTEQEIQLRDELAAQKLIVFEDRLSVQTKLADKALAEIEFYRQKQQEAMERADRQLDAFMTSVGMPEVTTLGQTERKEREVTAADRLKDREVELGELFGETMNMVHNEEGLEMTPELEADAAQMMAELKQEKPVAKNG